MLPQASSLVGRFDTLTREGAEPTALLLEGTRGLSGKVAGLIPEARGLANLARVLDEFRGGFAQLGDTLSAATSVNDRGGGYGQVDVLGFEDPRPENLGLPQSSAESAGGGSSPLERKLALAFERTCDDNPVGLHPALHHAGPATAAAHRRGRGLSWTIESPRSA